MNDDLKEAAEQTTENGRNAWREAASRAQQALEPLRAQASNAYSTAQQRSTEAIEAAEEYIKRSPMRAVAYTAGIAALLGIVGAALMGRRRGGDAKKPPE
jgi:ElaB/YqjD/DUF883 family membrane-anchored ribosome-binding protein